MKKLSMFFTKSLQKRLEQDPLLKTSTAMQFATQLPLRVLGFPARTSREDSPVPGDLLEKYFDGCSGESNGLARARDRAARIEATFSLVTDVDVAVAVQFFEKGEGGHFAEFVTSFDLATGVYHGVGWSESAQSDEITVTVRVKRGRTRQQVLDDTGREQHVNASSLESMPLIPGDGEEEVKFVFFRARRYLKNAEIESERARRGLVRDIEAQAQYNVDHLEFADKYHNADCWQDADENWHGLVFCHLGGKRIVRVERDDGVWLGDWWLGGAKPKAVSS